MPKYSKCVVESCGHCKQRHKECIYAKFPKDIERCRAWLKVVGNCDLVYLPPEKLNAIRYVCGCHFSDEQFLNSTRKRLKTSAIPTLFDERVQPLGDDVLREFPLARDIPRQPTTTTTVTVPAPVVPETGKRSLRLLLPKAPPIPAEERETILEKRTGETCVTPFHASPCNSDTMQVSEEMRCKQGQATTEAVTKDENTKRNRPSEQNIVQRTNILRHRNIKYVVLRKPSCGSMERQYILRCSRKPPNSYRRISSPTSPRRITIRRFPGGNTDISEENIARYNNFGTYVGQSLFSMTPVLANTVMLNIRELLELSRNKNRAV